MSQDKPFKVDFSPLIELLQLASQRDTLAEQRASIELSLLALEFDEDFIPLAEVLATMNILRQANIESRRPQYPIELEAEA